MKRQACLVTYKAVYTERFDRVASIALNKMLLLTIFINLIKLKVIYRNQLFVFFPNKIYLF